MTPEEAVRLEEALEPLDESEEALQIASNARWLACLLAGAVAGLTALGLLLVTVGG